MDIQDFTEGLDETDTLFEHWRWLGRIPLTYEEADYWRRALNMVEEGVIAGLLIRSQL